jgi:hypothetical protein
MGSKQNLFRNVQSGKAVSNEGDAIGPDGGEAAKHLEEMRRVSLKFLGIMQKNSLVMWR